MVISCSQVNKWTVGSFHTRGRGIGCGNCVLQHLFVHLGTCNCRFLRRMLNCIQYMQIMGFNCPCICVPRQESQLLKSSLFLSFLSSETMLCTSLSASKKEVIHPITFVYFQNIFQFHFQLLISWPFPLGCHASTLTVCPHTHTNLNMQK